MINKPFIGVIGGSTAKAHTLKLAEKVGQLIAERGGILVCGGTSGVMEASARGAKLAGGVTIGILPTRNRADANKFIDFPIATGIDIARNFVIACTCDGFVAIDGAYGTLTEIAYAIKLGKRVVSLESWGIPGVIQAKTPEEALDFLFENL